MLTPTEFIVMNVILVGAKTLEKHDAYSERNWEMENISTMASGRLTIISKLILHIKSELLISIFARSYKLR